MKIRGLLLDVEGVLVGDKRYLAVPSAVEFIRSVRSANCSFRLITNNTTDEKSEILAKLVRAGFALEPDELHTCTGAAVHLLREQEARRCLVLGNASLCRVFEDEGFEIAADSRVDAVVVGLDHGLTYERLLLATDAIVSHGAAFVALHRNRRSVDAAGRAVPSVGAIVAAIEYATQVPPVVMGKPSPAFFQQALDELALPPPEVLVVSDDPFSDLAGAKRMGMRAAFVLSGKYGDAGVLDTIPRDERPDLTVALLGDLLTQGKVSF